MMQLPLLLALASVKAADVQGSIAEASVKMSAPFLRQSGDLNPVISPANISQTMTMAAFSARESVRAIILKDSGYPDDYDTETIKQGANFDLLKQDKGETTAFLRTGYAVLANKDYTLQTGTVNRLKEIFNAKSGVADFESEAALLPYNKWFEERTVGKIHNLLTPDEISGFDAVLASVLAIKDQWPTAFKATPQPMKFKARTGTLDAPGVHAFQRASYYETAEGQFVAFTTVHTNSMLVLALPKGDRSPKDLLETAELRGDAAWAGRLVDATFPKWKTSTDWQLDALVNRIKKHSFDLLNEGPTYPSKWIHKVMFSVDEKGFEGAAASILGFRLGAAPKPEEPLAITYDRPFAYAVVHQPTKQVLMMGLVNAPSYSEGH